MAKNNQPTAVARPHVPESNPRHGRRRRRARGRRGGGKGRRAARRKNPWDGHAALTTGAGAGVGSIVGALVGTAVGFANIARKSMTGDTPSFDEMPGPGSVILAPALAWAGSIAGGAIGAHIGAPDKRERRGTLGGALGGMFGPIGAAAGGAIGAGYTKRRGNPAASTVALVVGGIAALAATAYGIRRWGAAMRLPPGTPTTPVEPTDPLVPYEPDPTAPVIPKVYVQAMYTGGEIAIKPTADHLEEDRSTVVIVPPSYPVDVVLSVPANFNPINSVTLSSNATIVAGQEDVSRDIVVRVTGPNMNGPTIVFGAEYWPTADTGVTNGLKVRME